MVVIFPSLFSKARITAGLVLKGIPHFHEILKSQGLMPMACIAKLRNRSIFTKTSGYEIMEWRSVFPCRGRHSYKKKGGSGSLLPVNMRLAYFSLMSLSKTIGTIWLIFTILLEARGCKSSVEKLLQSVTYAANN